LSFLCEQAGQQHKGGRPTRKKRCAATAPAPNKKTKPALNSAAQAIRTLATLFHSSCLLDQVSNGEPLLHTTIQNMGSFNFALLFSKTA